MVKSLYHLYEVKVSYDYKDRRYYAGYRNVVARTSEMARIIALEDVKRYRESKNNHFGNLYAMSITVLCRNILIQGEA